ncbi:hypothetical protein DMN91_001857 [Ooceraea biroi]|uniref:Uncharacterized protein n=1 Tax=Ooceraea biroi TaxID=2015173 RepID=A0A3L8DZ06_OOCBI|nr:hypothetical protein DMN91_001857 [Ooceraea biroi]
MGSKIDYADGYLEMSDMKIPFFSSETIIVPPRSESTFYIRLQNPEIKVGYLPKITLTQGIYLGDIIANNVNGKVHLPIISTLDKEVEIRVPILRMIPLSEYLDDLLADLSNDHLNKQKKEENTETVAKAKPPIVGFIPFGPAPWLKEYIDCPNYPNMRPYGRFYRYYYFFPASQRLAEQYVGHKIKPLRELEKTISIVLINSHFTFDNAIPLPPNTIEVGGMHAQVQSTTGVDATYYEQFGRMADFSVMQEAIWKGVPVIEMPFFLDHTYNVETLVAKGAGLRLDFKALSTQSVLNALEEIVYNKSYMENMKRLSNEYRDRALPPLDLAIWNIEYAVRNPNGLVSPVRSQSWMEKNLIDIYAILALSLVVILSAVFFSMKILYIYLCKSTASTSCKDKQM